jgi:hypothetical protein
MTNSAVLTVSLHFSSIIEHRSFFIDEAVFELGPRGLFAQAGGLRDGRQTLRATLLAIDNFWVEESTGEFQ